METPYVSVSANNVEVSGDTITIPLESAAFGNESVSVDQVSIEGAEVTDVKQGEDGQLLVTAKVSDVEDGETIANAISGAKITVGDNTGYANVADASFYAVFEGVMRDGDNVKFNITLLAEVGTFAEGINADAVSVVEGFEGGQVESLTREDEYTCSLVISAPATDSFNEESFNFVGTIELAEGALVQDWGDVAPACEFTRDYSILSLGRMKEDEEIDLDKIDIDNVIRDLDEPAGANKNAAASNSNANNTKTTSATAKEAQKVYGDKTYNELYTWVGRMSNDEKKNFNSALSTIDKYTTGLKPGEVLTEDQKTELDRANAYMAQVKNQQELQDKVEKEENEFRAKVMANAVSGMAAYTEFVSLLDLDPDIVRCVQIENEVVGALANGVAGNYGAILQNTLNIAKILGVFKTKNPGPTINDVMGEMAEINDVLKTMESQLKKTDEDDKRDKQNDLTGKFSNMKEWTDSLLDLYKAAKSGYSLESDKTFEDFDGLITDESSEEEKEAAKEELEDYCKGLYQYMQERCDAKDPDFKWMETYTKDLKDIFIYMAGRYGEAGDGNPIYQFDKMIAYNYQWQTEGYYERAMYRANLTDIFNKAFMALCFFDQTYSSETRYNKLKAKYDAVMNQIAERSPGPSADSVRRNKLNQDKNGVYRFVEIKKNEKGEYQKDKNGEYQYIDTDAGYHDIACEKISIRKDGKHYVFYGGPEGCYTEGTRIVSTDNQKSTKALIEGIELNLDPDTNKSLSDNAKLKMKFDAFLKGDGVEIVTFTGATVYNNDLGRFMRLEWPGNGRSMDNAIQDYSNCVTLKDEQGKVIATKSYLGILDSLKNAGAFPSAIEPNEKTVGIVLDRTINSEKEDDWKNVLRGIVFRTISTETWKTVSGKVLYWYGGVESREFLDSRDKNQKITPVIFTRDTNV